MQQSTKSAATHLFVIYTRQYNYKSSRFATVMLIRLNCLETVSTTQLVHDDHSLLDRILLGGLSLRHQWIPGILCTVEPPLQRNLALVEQLRYSAVVRGWVVIAYYK